MLRLHNTIPPKTTTYLMFAFQFFLLHLQLVSNDEYHSVEHRVRIKSSADARVSVAMFYNPTGFSNSDMLGPFPELITAEKLARYRNFTMEEFMDSRTKFGHGRSSTDHFKVADE